MKKSLVFALIMVLAMAGIASAEAKFGGEFKTEYVIDTNKDAPAGTGTASAPLKLKLSAEEEGVWSVKADLKANAAKGAELKVGDWSMNLTDELFVADLWGGDVEKAGIKTPLEFVKTADDVAAAEGSAHMRLTSDVAGYVDLTLDYEPNDNLFLFASKELDAVTVGGAIRTDLRTEPIRAAGHVKYGIGAATLTGEVGLDTEPEEDNFMVGGKVGYELTDELTLNGQVTYKAKNVGDALSIKAGADYVEDLFKVGGAVTRADDLDNDATKATYKVEASGTYRTNEDVAYDDLFDDYDTLTGYAAYAKAAFTTAKDYVDAEWTKTDEKPVMEVTLKGAGVVVPEMVWLYGDFAYKSDEDKTVKDDDFQFIISNNKLTEESVLLVKDYFKVTGEATVQLTDKVKLVPAVKYGKWNTLANTETEEKKDENGNVLDSYYNGLTAKDMNELDLTAAVTYALSASSEVGLSYTDRTQKFTEPSDPFENELKDGFAKIWFKTKF